MRYPEILSTLDEDATKIWLGHAMEEIEHRAVAFDVYKGDKVRRTVMLS